MASVTSNSVAGVIDAQLIAYNDNVTRLAVSSGNKIQLLIKSDDLQTWQTSTEWQAAGASRMTEMAWAHSEHGDIIACASEDGIISIYQQNQPKDDEPSHWKQTASLGESIKPITSIQFAPRQLGLQLAAASEDGFVRFYQSNRPLDANKWQLSNDLQASTSEPCTSLAWRQHSYGLPAMLCIGTSQEAQIWYYRPHLGDWYRTARLETGGSPVAAIHWAPTLGRPVELTAAACGNQVLIWSLTGKAHSLQIKQMACLDTEGEVWKVKFAKFGNMLAASTAGNNSSSIYVWELRPTAASAASWVLHSRLNGNAAAGDDAMLEG